MVFHRWAPAAGLLLLASLHGQPNTNAGGTPVRIVVTVEGKHDSPTPELKKDDVIVRQGSRRPPITEWTPMRGAEGALQLWILIDDSLETTLGTQFGELKKFVAAQAPATQVGLGYIRNGSVEVLQPLTTDRDRVTKAIRIPTGLAGGAASPYIALAEFARKWPQTASRRAVLMVSSGIDYYYGPGPENPYLQQAIDETQRAGVAVHSIYWGAIGHFAHSNWQVQWGQNDLAQLCDATGGESYWQGFGNPVSFAPFLDDLSHRFQNQYALTFLANPGKKADFQRISVTTEVPQATVVAPARVWVPQK
jgi:hypothetical protein